MPEQFILLTRLLSDEARPSFALLEKSRLVQEKIGECCPEVSWVSNYAIMGPWDYLDVFQAPDIATAMTVATLVRAYGGAHTEVWPAMSWPDFKATLQDTAKSIRPLTARAPAAKSA